VKHVASQPTIEARRPNQWELLELAARIAITPMTQKERQRAGRRMTALFRDMQYQEEGVA